MLPLLVGALARYQSIPQAITITVRVSIRLQYLLETVRY
jgi:hypothetical protein